MNPNVVVEQQSYSSIITAVNNTRYLKAVFAVTDKEYQRILEAYKLSPNTDGLSLRFNPTGTSRWFYMLPGGGIYQVHDEKRPTTELEDFLKQFNSPPQPEWMKNRCLEIL